MSPGPPTGAVGRTEGDASRPWRRHAAQLTIGVLVVVHFSIGLFITLPPRNKIWTIPLLSDVAALYARHRLDQSWSMFAPPPRVDTEIHYAIRFADGWTDLAPLQAFALKQAKATLVQPRGIFRLATFLRSTSTDQDPDLLAADGGRAFYYQQIADFLCSGDGKIPGAIAIRLYLVGKRAPYFFETDPYGKPQPPLSDFSFQQALYEQACAQP